MAAPLRRHSCQTVSFMNAPSTTTFSAVLLRKDPRLPVYVVVPYARIAHWDLDATAIVEGTINGLSFGRRSLKRMDTSPRSDWFVDLTAPICKALGITVGDELSVSMRLAPTDIPEELEALLAANPGARASWNLLPAYVRRTSEEHIRAGKGQFTRLRRAQAILSKLGPHEVPARGKAPADSRRDQE